MDREPSRRPILGNRAGCILVAVLVPTVLVVGALVAVRMIANAARDTATASVQAAADAVKGLAAAFRPQVNVSQVIQSAVGSLDPKLELKVAEREVDSVVEVTKETTWLKVPVGRTVTKVRLQGNRVQYVVPLGGLLDQRAWEFLGGTDGGALLVHLPPPRVDERMVAVQTDPARKQVSVDDQWLNNVMVWESDGSDEAIARIRVEAARQAQAPALLEEVKRDAAPRLASLLQAALQGALRGGVQVRVVFDGAAPEAPGLPR